MGGLRKKMPYTAYTMLVGCMAIAGFGVPFVIGFSGYYSKDAIIAQAMAFKTWQPERLWGAHFFVAAAGAAITAFYMFRLWFMTFSGKPRDHHIYDHAHESPKVMYLPAGGAGRVRDRRRLADDLPPTTLRLRRAGICSNKPARPAR